MRGFKPQRKQKPEAKEKQKQQEVPDKRAHPITEYAGGYETARRLKAMGLKDGGPVRGPGTGTSDDIEAVVPEGSYIMPADSTEALGEEALAGLGAPVPVNLSNGEYQLPPEQVHAIGVQALDQIKNATHTPTDDADTKPEMFFADGGEVRRPYYVDRQGTASQINPNTPRLGAPQPQAALPAPQGRPALPPGVDVSTGRVSLNHLLPQSQGAAGAQPGIGAGPRVAPAPAAGFQEPDWQGRAQQMHRVKRDTAGYEAERSRQDARFADAEKRARQSRSTSRIQGARGIVNRAGRGGALAAIPAIASAAEEDSTARYARRFGVSEPTGDGSPADIAKFAALRAGGFATDLGSTLTFGLADKLYRDKQAVDTDAMAQTGGAVAGAVGGRKAAQLAGRVFDATARGVTRGRYKGNLGQRAADSWVGRYAAPVVGAGMGVNAANAMTGDEQPDAAAPQPSRPAETAIEEQASAATPMNNNVTRVGNSFSAMGPIREGYTVNGQDPGLAPGTIRNLDDDGAPQEQAGSQGQQPYPGMPVVHGRGFRAGGPQAIFLRDRTQDDRERRAALRDASTVQRGARGLTRSQVEARNQLIRGPQQDAAALEREAMRQAGADRRAASRDAIDWMRAASEMQARGFQSRAAERMERLYQQYESAQTPQERSVIAQAIRELQGQSRPPYQIATTEELIDPANPMMGTRRLAYVIDPATGQGRPVSGEQSQGRQFVKGEIYEDANGNLARWDGQQFVSVQ